MRHRISVDSISRYADGVYRGRAKEALQAHVHSCAICQGNLSILRNYKLLLTGLGTIKESEYFDFEFRRKLDGALEGSRARRPVRGARLTRAIEDLRRALTPPAPVLARVVVSLFIMFSVGMLGLYYTRVESPSVVAISGTAKLSSVRYGERDIRLAMKVRQDDVITTGEGSALDIGVSDNFAVRLKEGSRLKIARLGRRHGGGDFVFELSDGKVLVKIDKEVRGSRVIVRTRALEASAIGTKFLVESSQRERGRTKVGVLDGSVEIKTARKPTEEGKVVLGAGQKIESGPEGSLGSPQRLIEQEWQELEELYQIGKKPLVMLLVKNTPMRVRELLRPCPLYFYDEKPRTLPELFEKALLSIDEAIKAGDRKAHLESIHILEDILTKNPNPKYEPQLELFIGAYYEYLGYHRESITAFQKVIAKYPTATYASMAKCAIGLVYEEKLSEKEKAEREYQEILQQYPYSLEATFVEEKLGIKKVSD